MTWGEVNSNNYIYIKPHNTISVMFYMPKNNDDSVVLESVGNLVHQDSNWLVVDDENKGLIIIPISLIKNVLIMCD